MQREIIVKPGDKIPAGTFIAGWSLNKDYPKGSIVVYIESD